MNLKKKLLCEWLDLHVGHPEAVGDGIVAFRCTRCGRLRNPVTPEQTRQLYKEEGIDYDELRR